MKEIDLEAANMSVSRKGDEGIEDKVKVRVIRDLDLQGVASMH